MITLNIEHFNIIFEQVGIGKYIKGVIDVPADLEKQYALDKVARNQEPIELKIVLGEVCEMTIEGVLLWLDQYDTESHITRYKFSAMRIQGGEFH